MKVKELIEALSELDGELEVILQKDGEGNGYSPLSGADDDAVYVPETGWCGTVHTASGSADDACLDEDEWQELLNGPRCVVLFPMN